MTKTSTDRIEKQIQIQAPRSKVWRALTNAKAFGEWFGVVIDGEFVVGKKVIGSLTIKSYEGVKLEVVVERVKPETEFAYRWHPYAVDRKADYSKEEMTLVEFTLVEEGGGTLVRVVESGFDRLPPNRRDEAFRMNSGGWSGQLGNIKKHVSG